MVKVIVLLLISVGCFGQNIPIVGIGQTYNVTILPCFNGNNSIGLKCYSLYIQKNLFYKTPSDKELINYFRTACEEKEFMKIVHHAKLSPLCENYVEVQMGTKSFTFGVIHALIYQQ